MRRLHGALTAFALAALAGPAAAAEITRVATSGEPGNPFDLDISVRWDRFDERATHHAGEGRRRPARRHHRRWATSCASPARGTRSSRAIAHRPLERPRASRRAARTCSATTGPGATGSCTDKPTGGVADSILDREQRHRRERPAVRGGRYPGPCPLFPVAPTTTVYHGGRAGDLKAGLAWGIFNDQKDDTKPFWLVGMDVTFPTAAAVRARRRAAPPTPGPRRLRRPGEARPVRRADLEVGRLHGDVPAHGRRRSVREGPRPRRRSSPRRPTRTATRVREATAARRRAEQQMNDLAVAELRVLGLRGGREAPLGRRPHLRHRGRARTRTAFEGAAGRRSTSACSPTTRRRSASTTSSPTRPASSTDRGLPRDGRARRPVPARVEVRLAPGDGVARDPDRALPHRRVAREERQLRRRSIPRATASPPTPPR